MGSEGDIRPLLALGHGLARRGHDVELLYTDIDNRRYETAASALGVTARAVATPVIADPAALDAIGLAAMAKSNALAQGQFISERLFLPARDEMYAAAVDLCRRCDAVAGHFFLYPLRAAAEQAGRPEISVTLAHNTVPSREVHPTGLPRLGAWTTTLGWRLAQFALNRVMLPEVNRFRRRIGLGPQADMMRDVWTSPLLNLVAVSPALLRRPRDWATHHVITGFLSLPETHVEAVPAEVTAFLQQAQAPVFFSFGSLLPKTRSELDATIDTFRDAARLAGCRAIIQPGEGHLERYRNAADDAVLFAGRLAHSAVFPRCAAVVHHAGAGTVQTTLRAGVPSVPVPHVSDQPFWADELRRAGVAPRSVSRGKMTAARLASCLRGVLDDREARARAATIADAMRLEHGPDAAALAVDAALADTANTR